jgi:regulator of replication initiation timing
MTISNTLADQIGSLDAQIKALQEQLEELKEEAKASGLDEIEGRVFIVSIGKSIRASLDTASVKKELGQSWYDDHCKMAEVTTVRIKARPEALANLS